MFELKNQIQICLTVAERSKCVRELEDLFCEVDSVKPSHSYSFENIQKKYPTVAELFKLMVM